MASHYDTPRNDGLIGGFELGSGRDLGEAWSSAWPRDSGLGSGEVWLLLDRMSDAASAWLHESSGLSLVVIRELLADATRPRVRLGDSGVLLTLRGVNLNPGATPEDMISIRLWADRRGVVSLHGPRLLSVDALLEKYRAGGGPNSVGDLLVTIAGGLIQRMGPVIEQIIDDLDSFEDGVVDPTRSAERADLIRVRQRAITLHRYLSSQWKALRELHAGGSELLTAQNRRGLEEVVNQVERYVEDLDEAKARAGVVQDELANQLAERANLRMYVVTVIAAIFLPLTLISGLLGMNVGGIPLASHHFGFLGVSAAMVVLALGGYWFFRRSDWL